MQSLSYALRGISSAHISTFSLTSAQANHVTRSDGHSLCACLTFSTDICAADPRSTAYIQYSLRMSRFFPRHVRQQSPLYSVYHDFHAHISLVAMRCGYEQRTCDSWKMPAYKEMPKVHVHGPSAHPQKASFLWMRFRLTAFRPQKCPNSWTGALKI